jgi:hypothetical protein
LAHYCCPVRGLRDEPFYRLAREIEQNHVLCHHGHPQMRGRRSDLALRVSIAPAVSGFNPGVLQHALSSPARPTPHAPHALRCRIVPYLDQERRRCATPLARSVAGLCAGAPARHGRAAMGGGPDQPNSFAA